MTDTADPVDEMADVVMARYALAARAIAAVAVAMGLPAAEVAASLARERETFLAELAAVVSTARAACDDPSAPRH